MENNEAIVNETVETPAEQEEVKTYTQEEVMALLQKESDKRVTEALKKQQKKYEQKLSLTSLDEQQRKEAEAQMKIQELQEQLAAFQIEKNKSELKSVLSSRGLSAEFADIINISDDLETSQANIDKLDKLFKAAVKAEVENRLKLAGSTPKGNSTTATVKNSVKEMSMAELQRLAIEEPEVFARLTNK